MTAPTYTGHRERTLSRAARALRLLKDKGRNLDAVAPVVGLSVRQLRQVANCSNHASLRAAALVLRGLQEQRQQLPLPISDQRSMDL